jgi:hypothetical protein
MKAFKLILSAVLIFLYTASIAQTIQVSGTVLDERSKQPLAFVTIAIGNSGNGFSTDIDGRFTASIEQQTETLIFSYIGYQKKEVSVAELGSNSTIFLSQTGIDVNEVTILPGINPADVIMDRVIDNRKINNPEEATEFSYDSYNKLVFTVNPDSVSKQVELQKDSINKDTSIQSAIDYVSKQHFIVMESVSHRDFISANKDKEVVLASRVSGLKSPDFTLIGTQLQSFSFYKDYVELMDYRLLSPISKGATSQYLFILEDSIVDEGEMYYTISFQPKKGKNFEALKGQLFIHKGDYAIKSVTASPAKAGGGIDMKIQQLYEKVDGQWFPTQLNSNLTFNSIMLGPFPLYGVGRSYLKNIELESQRPKNKFDNVVLEMDRKIKSNTDSLLNAFRIDTLDVREERTYQKMDSIGEAEKLDEKLRLIKIVTRGYIPLGPVNVDMDKFGTFNNYEGIRLGLGAHTNDRISDKVSLGGYFAYGFQDKNWKYGGHLRYRPFTERDLEFTLSYTNDVLERGGVQFDLSTQSPISTENYRKLYIYQMDLMEQVRFEKNFSVLKSWQISLFGQHNRITSGDDYRFTRSFNENTRLIYNQFEQTEVGIETRFAYGEKFAELFGMKISSGTKYPVGYFKYTRGLSSNESAFDYNKFEARVAKLFVIRNAGELNVQLIGGYMDASAPLLFNYTPTGVNKGFQLSVANTFETARPNEFFHNRFASLFLRHNFKKLLYKGDKFQPEFVLHTAFGVGDMRDQSNHLNIDFDQMDRVYMESGLIANDLLKMPFLSYGAGVFYRYGHYASPDELDNFFFKLAMRFGF